MPSVMEQFLGYLFFGTVIGIPVVGILWVIRQNRLSAIVALVSAAMAGVLTLAYLVGLPELFGWLPTGTILFPEGYQFHLYRNLTAYYMGNISWGAAVMIAMYGFWSLREKAQSA